MAGDKDLSLLYAQDMSCAASFWEGRVFRVNPARPPAPEVVRLAGLEGRLGVLTTSKPKLVPAVGKAFANSKRDFRLESDVGGGVLDRRRSRHQSVGEWTEGAGP